MVPDAKAVRAELLKLNIYGEGGHFVSHRDTPASRDMFGSLVVCLPVVRTHFKLNSFINHIDCRS